MPTLARRGPQVHVCSIEGWRESRAFVAIRPIRCGMCPVRIEPGETVVRPFLGAEYVCGRCIIHHVRGTTRCPLCLPLKRRAPKCRHCAGTGYASEPDA